jgi:hypothetical protein
MVQQKADILTRILSEPTNLEELIEKIERGCQAIRIPVTVQRFRALQLGGTVIVVKARNKQLIRSIEEGAFNCIHVTIGFQKSPYYIVAACKSIETIREARYITQYCDRIRMDEGDVMIKIGKIYEARPVIGAKK